MKIWLPGWYQALRISTKSSALPFNGSGVWIACDGDKTFAMRLANSSSGHGKPVIFTRHGGTPIECI